MLAGSLTSLMPGIGNDSGGGSSSSSSRSHNDSVMLLLLAVDNAASTNKIHGMMSCHYSRVTSSRMTW